MTKNLYFQTVIQRANRPNAFAQSTFRFMASYTRLLLEVFIRKDFGERYFSFSKAINLTIFLGIVPLISKVFSMFWPGSIGAYSQGGFIPSQEGSSSFWLHYASWYIFLGYFVYKCIGHRNDLKRNPTVFDFARYSLSRGKIHPKFYEISLFGIEKGNKRFIEVFLEPALFFVIGVALIILTQRVGILIVFCSLWYRSSYIAAYAEGDHFIMDKIDEIICNEELKKTFVDDVDVDQTRGFDMPCNKPKSKELREQIMPLMIKEDEVLDAI